MIYSLLSDEVNTNVAVFIAIAAIAATFIILGILAYRSRNTMNTRKVVFAGVSIATSFVLSFIKFEFSFGGSITLASSVPILIYSYAYGLVPGFSAGIIYGLLVFIREPYILTPLTFLLDYILPYAMIGLMSIPKRFIKNQLGNIVVGTVIVYLFKYLMHILSGIFYFNIGYVVDAFPQSNAFIYSALYNGSYLLPDMMICLIVFVILVKTNILSRLLGIMATGHAKKKRFEYTEPTTDNASEPAEDNADEPTTGMVDSPNEDKAD